MSWGRGFFRLWLLVAVVWVIAIGLMNVPQTVDKTLYYSPWDDAFHASSLFWNYGCDRPSSDWRAHCERMADDIVKKGVSRPGPSGFTLVYPRLGVGERLDEVLLYAADYSKHQLAFASLAQPAEDTAKRLDELQGKALADYNRLVSERQHESLKNVALGGLLPPLVLLALGFAVRWVLIGFRKQAA